MGWANFLSDLKTRSRSEFSFCSALLFVVVVCFVNSSSLMVTLGACSVWLSDPVLPPLLLLNVGGLGLGGGVDFPKECFLGDDPAVDDNTGLAETGGTDAGCFKAFLFNPPEVFLIELMAILSELPFNFSRLELVELAAESPGLFKKNVM